ncbi:hypothetical protein [Ciceribacter selenitireducens]|jgi:hypothetical protein|uniref:hypothetical protein n=1 Tax=Ciceribacter selenitireducens TaxID=448181 RepID=UPI0011C053FC|nr:hypothetical protein [Ciceribacter selenitireducens]
MSPVKAFVKYRHGVSATPGRLSLIDGAKAHLPQKREHERFGATLRNGSLPNAAVRPREAKMVRKINISAAQ